MKSNLSLIVLVLVLSCNQNNKTKELQKSETIENFDWLTGKWKRLNEEAGKETFENWNKINPNEYSGIGFTIKNGDTINQEKIKLIKSNEKWALLVKTPDDKEPIKFKMLEQKTPTEFTCVNDSIDFPKRVQYWSEGGKLKAKVSNDKIQIPFEFEKIK
ncbi:DUF6265 family protein [Epilithonimonas sp.]|uniref:DUF6265 family protein n=1 Tax=Epilithonimonas sp. TaxID=2894511 RepID=UPI0028998FCF|nr:DUF6265 family protein [Epilithonimonas sp.]